MRRFEEFFLDLKDMALVRVLNFMAEEDRLPVGSFTRLSDD